MKKYTFVSEDAKKVVDLRQYRSIIEDAVHQVMPNAKVEVCEDGYYVDPTPTHSQAIRIGKLICKSVLNTYCVMISKLFNGTEVVESEENVVDEQQEQHNETKTGVGGHH